MSSLLQTKHKVIPWLPGEDEQLRTLALTASWTGASEILGRTVSALRHRAKILGIKFVKPRANNTILWTDERKARFFELVAAGYTAKEIATLLGISKNAVVGFAYRSDVSFNNSPTLIKELRGTELVSSLGANEDKGGCRWLEGNGPWAPSPQWCGQTCALRSDIVPSLPAIQDKLLSYCLKHAQRVYVLSQPQQLDVN
jgi:hypothetical protein